MSDSTEPALQAALREAGAAHAEAFAATGGEDPDWPRWYAERLAPRLSELFRRALAPEELAAELEALDREHREHALSEDWPAYYARRLARRQDCTRP